MRIELKNHALTADIDVKKEWPMLWHTNAEDEKVNDFSMAPGKIHLELSGDVTLDTGSLKMTDCMNLMRVIAKLDTIHAEKVRRSICEEIRKEVS